MSDDNPEFSNDAEEPGARKSFWEHVQDLRTALIRSALAIGVALMFCLLLTPQIVNILVYPLRRTDVLQKLKPRVTLQIGQTQIGSFEVTPEQSSTLPPGVYQFGTAQIGKDQVVTLKLDPKAKAENPLAVSLKNYSPTEAFMVAFHVAVYAAVVVSAPIWIYYLGGFIIPAFKRKERTAVFSWVGWGVALAATGVLLTYFLLLPVALRASAKYSEYLGFGATEWKADEYIGFVCKFIFGMGIGFQFPLVVLFMVKLGLVTRQQLAHYRRHVVVISLILGAILTTPEPVTQVAMAVPLYVLYEVCIWVAWYWEWKKKKAQPL